jgi:hypothetical protein
MTEKQRSAYVGAARTTALRLQVRTEKKEKEKKERKVVL